jgi:adenylylsulfate kinase-like enzyme
MFADARHSADVHHPATAREFGMDDASLFVVTGVMAAGKSTIGQALAETVDELLQRRGESMIRP